MPKWIELQGVANLRDVGGIPTTDGGSIAVNRLLRSDNLQTLTAQDIAELQRRGLTDVIDLRSVVEKVSEGPGPMTRQQDVALHHHSLFIEQEPEEQEPDRAEPEEAEPAAAPAAALPWIGKESSTAHEMAVTSHYLSYLTDRPDSVLAALRAIANAGGAALVHCAAGKDRTGTVVALALLVAGADPEAVIADYAASSDRVQQVLDRLLASPTYADNLRGRPVESHLSDPAIMRAMIDRLNEQYGGVEPYLRTIGWTDADSAAMRGKLRD
ncbi:MAG: tyrosine-protein phosphatase [Actinomycetota bacterium]|nr:tyrosine-protein phosphatase [Actinomycetota bacterium]